MLYSGGETAEATEEYPQLEEKVLETIVPFRNTVTLRRTRIEMGFPLSLNFGYPIMSCWGVKDVRSLISSAAR